MREYVQLLVSGFDSNGSHWTDSYCFEIDDQALDNHIVEHTFGATHYLSWLAQLYSFGMAPGCVNEAICLYMVTETPNETTVGYMNRDCFEQIADSLKNKCLNFSMFEL